MVQVSKLRPTVVVYSLPAGVLDNPVSADWAVNALAPAAVDTLNSGLVCRRFDDVTEEGIGFFLPIPSPASSITIGLKSRAQTAPGTAKVVQTKLYTRTILDNLAVPAWTSGTLLDLIDLPANAFWQYNAQTIALTTVGLVAGKLAQFELTRIPTGNTLVGDWSLLEVGILFS